MSLAAGSRIGSYEIVSLLGAGGMGEVYRARDAKLHRDVAVKILPPAFATEPDRLARFEREAQVLASLNHPNIAAIYGFEEGRALVLELVDGPTLADRLAQGPVPLDEALPIARQIAEALEAAHEHGVIHRDLKPANIKLRADGTVKVLDFGLARATGPAEPGHHAASGLSMSPTVMSPAMTQLGVILGTAAYMSPEQARGKAVDRRADVWAFGCVLYEMLTAKAPFADEDISLTLSKILQREVDWSALPVSATAVEPLLRRCLDKDPRTRLRDIGEARIALSSLASGPAAHDPARLQTRGLSYTVAAAALIITAGVAAAATWILRPVSADTALPVVRLAVTLPAGERLAGAQGFTADAWMPLAMSPDGTQLAYVSGSRLFLRPMNGLDVRGTQGTDGAASPFFSPDGGWIGFVAQGQLKKVSVTGGLATPLTSAPVAAGASWAADGSIYFAPTNITGIWRVSANGGEAEAVTALDRAKGEVSHRWPQVLPGGKAILFTVWRGPGWDEMDIHVHDLSTGQRSVLIQGGSTGRYVRSGHLVYVRAGELMAAPFDLARLVLTGESRSLGIAVREGEGGHFTVSDSGLLAYVPATPIDRRLVLMSRDGTVADLGAPLRPYEDIVQSPDGRRVAVTTLGPTWGIWVFDLDAKREILLTRGSPTSQWPVWTPDGSRIIYRGTRAGSRNLYWRRADGTGDEERLTSDDSMQTPVSVSPDGRWLAYEEIAAASTDDLRLLPLDGSRTPQPLIATAAREGGAQFSPDGRWLAFESDDSGRVQVYVQPFPGPGERVPVSTGAGMSPGWSHDGRRIFYLDGETVMEAEISTAPVVRVGAPRPAFTLINMLGSFEIMRDGRLLGIQRTGTAEAATQIHVVVNWFQELAQRVPVN